MISKRSDRLTIAACLLASLLLSVSASAADPCQQYYGKGYCTDYVNGFLTKRIGGDARNWPATIILNNIQAGDVAIFASENHVARVESVNYRAGRPVTIEVSEMNYGRGWINQACLVTTNFGKITRRVVDIGRISGVYRESRISMPTGGQTGTANSTPPIKAIKK